MFECWMFGISFNLDMWISFKSFQLNWGGQLSSLLRSYIQSWKIKVQVSKRKASFNRLRCEAMSGGRHDSMGSNFEKCQITLFIIRLYNSYNMWYYYKHTHFNNVVNKAKATVWKPSCCFLFKPALVSACNQVTDTLTWIQNERSCC